MGSAPSERQIRDEDRGRIRRTPGPGQTVCPYTGYTADDDAFAHSADIEAIKRQIVHDAAADVSDWLGDLARDFNRRQPRRGLISMSLEHKPNRAARPVAIREDLLRDLRRYRSRRASGSPRGSWDDRQTGALIRWRATVPAVCEPPDDGTRIWLDFCTRASCLVSLGVFQRRFRRARGADRAMMDAWNDLVGTSGTIIRLDVVALGIETGDREWHFQAVHHGLWDWDGSAGRRHRHPDDLPVGGPAVHRADRGRRPGAGADCARAARVTDGSPSRARGMPLMGMDAARAGRHREAESSVRATGSRSGRLRQRVCSSPVGTLAGGTTPFMRAYTTIWP